MDLEVVRTFSPWVLAGFSAGTSLIALLVNRFFATKKEVEEIRQKQELLESQVENLPDRDDWHQVQLSIEGVRGELKVLNAQLQPLQHINNLRLENDIKEKENA